MNIMYNDFKTAKQVGENRRERRSLQITGTLGGKTGGLIYTRPDFPLCLQTQAVGSKELWALGTFCSDRKSVV